MLVVAALMYSVQPNSADSATINPAALSSPGMSSYAVVAWWCASSPRCLPFPSSRSPLHRTPSLIAVARCAIIVALNTTLRRHPCAARLHYCPLRASPHGVVLGPLREHPWPHSPLLARATTPLSGNRHWGRSRHGSAEPTRLRTQLFHFPA